MIETRYQLLKYQIIGASTKDPDYPVEKINSNTPLGGWHSSRFCLYPQEILIKFPYPVHIRQINLLFHETLIPSRVDIYHFFPSSFNDLMTDYNSLIFDKIGYIKPDSNTLSDYQCREYKRIAIAENCYYLKLVFQKNINNIYNPFNQVALVNLQCFGFVYAEANLSEIFKDKFHKNNHNIYNNPEEFDNLIKTENFDKYIPVGEIKDDSFNKKVADKLIDLNIHLDRAKYFNDYDKAKQIDDYINRVRLIGYKVEHLNKLKRIAVDKEDYPKAKEIKAEIDKLLGYIDEIHRKYYRVKTPPIHHEPPEDKLEFVRPSPEPSLNEDIKKYREIDEIPRKKIQYDIAKEEKIITQAENIEEEEKEIKPEDLEKRGFHNVDEEIEIKKNKEKEELIKTLFENDEDDNIINNTFSEEDSIREELRYKIK